MADNTFPVTVTIPSELNLPDPTLKSGSSSTSVNSNTQPPPIQAEFFQLIDWTIEREHVLLDKLDLYGLTNVFSGWTSTKYPNLRGVYMVPSDQKVQVERMVEESITLKLKDLGIADAIEGPSGIVGFKKDNSLLMIGIILFIVLLIIILR